MESGNKLSRFIEAQNATGFAGYNNAIEEIKRGKKLSHWIWYVFPQLRSLCQSSLYDKKYGIENLEEAKAYLGNSILRERYNEACEILLNHQENKASLIFGVSDASRVRSSLTLFYLASQNDLYKQVLDKFYNGNPCRNTLFALNMEMPVIQKVDRQNQQSSQRSKKTSQTHTARRNPIKSTSRQGASLNGTKKKRVVMILGLFAIMMLFGCLGYGLYALYVDYRAKTDMADGSQQTTDSPSIDFHLGVSVMTSDHEAITYGDKDKYSISVLATLGDNAVPWDSTTSKFDFFYSKENCAEEIKIGAKIETCEIGSRILSLSGYDVQQGSYDETFVLNVSKADLRIYEELAWYQAVKQKVSAAKYPKYVERIKNVKNRDFAAFLTEKLSAIGQYSASNESDSGGSQKQKNERSGVNGNLPKDIMMRVHRAVPVPLALLKEVSPQERRIIESYNHYILRSEARRNEEKDKEVMRIRLRLRSCTTYHELERILRFYRD